MVSEVVEKGTRDWTGVARWEFSVAGKWVVLGTDISSLGKGVVYES